MVLCATVMLALGHWWLGGLMFVGAVLSASHLRIEREDDGPDY